MILDLFRLNGRVALVTGATRGLGLAMAGGLAEAGADVFSVSLDVDDSEARDSVEAAGRRFWSMTADLGNPAERAELIDRVVATAGRIDILVNNAGFVQAYPPEIYPLSAWSTLLEVHLTAAFDLCQQAAPYLLRQGRGKIINIGSVMSVQGGFKIPAYAAAKHGLAGLTKALATSWSSRGINVNCICPGFFETTLTDFVQDDPVRGPQILERIPCGRWGQPEELAGTVVYLASDAANYLHGAILTVDGGWLAN